MGSGRKRCTGDGRLLFVELQMEVDDCLDAVPEHVEGHVLVGRMDAVRLKSEAHEDGLHTENLLESGDDGDASASANGQRAAPKHFLKSASQLLCRLADR